jgi:DnaJ-domain-containing protein 1
MTVGKHTRPPRTLYELLRVRPNADDDALRIAYRNAVKATHPDLNPGKADTRKRFEQIVRAYEILNNPEQRAEYDALLAFERAERRAKLRRIIATDAATIVALSVVLVGGYAMFGNVSLASLEVAKLAQVAERQVARLAAVEPITKAGPTTQNPPSEKVPEIGASIAQSSAVAPSTLAPSAVAPSGVPPSSVAPSEYGRNPPVVASDREAQTSVAEAEPKDASRQDEPSAKSEPAEPGNTPIAQSASTPEAAEKAPETAGNDDQSGGHAVEVAAPTDTVNQAKPAETPSSEAHSSEVPSNEPAAATAAAPNSEQPVTAGKDEPVKDEPTKPDVNEAAAPTAETVRPAEPSDDPAPPEPANAANLQSPTAPEIRSTDPSITGSGGPAASPTGSDSGATPTVDTATAPISNPPVARGDVRENDRKDDSGPDPLDQNSSQPANTEPSPFGKRIEMPRPRPVMLRPGQGREVKMAGRTRGRDVRSTEDHASTKQATLESRSAPQVAFENRTNHVTPVFGVGF